MEEHSEKKEHHTEHKEHHAHSEHHKEPEHHEHKKEEHSEHKVHEHKEASHEHHKKPEHHEPKVHHEHKEVKHEAKGFNGWKALSGLLILLLIFSIYTGGFKFGGSSGDGMSKDAASAKALTFIKGNLVPPGTDVELQSVDEKGNVYLLNVNIDGSPYESFITKDGSYLFPGGLNIDEIPIQDVVGGDEPGIQPESPVDMTELADDDAVKGDENAPVTIVEFSDFECPYCGRFFKETLPLIDEKYIKTGKVKLVYRDYPLPNHPFAQKAAEAAECAGEQDKFYEMHDKLFIEGVSGGVDDYKKYAADIGLDTDVFDACLDNGVMAGEIQVDLRDGDSAGISGTPGFIINGEIVSGAQPFEVFEQIIEEKLLAAGNLAGVTGDVVAVTSEGATDEAVSVEVLGTDDGEESSETDSDDEETSTDSI
ncbi:MAG: thioredoxin domain-containing protein [Candidatus Woesearchaeota archaeon]|nr:thioredoxin domain-containing protein [Candidatus Woesearchaeota archaeon]MDP7323852.1 thioredoxin domain-containing protein [Candidatus Woesearchaeota archaeon]